MADSRVIFRVHAVQRMFERSISEVDVRLILETGEVIESYPDESPYPSRLILGYCDNRPVHVVAADVPEEDLTVIITVYEPDPARWDGTFRRRTRP